MKQMKKLYKINSEAIAKTNIAHFNNTMKSIIKTMYRLQKEDLMPSCGMTGDEILREAIRLNLWQTKQEDSKLHTTWAFYVKRLKEEAHVLEVGKTQDLVEEYLE
jgi:hypothetical protein